MSSPPRVRALARRVRTAATGTATMPVPEREAFVNNVLQYVVYTGGPEYRAEQEAAMRQRCHVMYDIYAGPSGLAATFEQLHTSVAREQEATGHRDRVVDFIGPIVAALHTGAHADSIRRAVICASRNREWQRQSYRSRSHTVLHDTRLRALQERVATTLQPVYTRARMASAQQMLLHDRRAQAVVTSSATASSDEPRACFMTAKAGDEQTAIGAINEMWGITHPHRACRVAAGSPFGIRDGWVSVRLTGEGVTRITGASSVVAVLTDTDDETLTATMVMDGRRGDALPPSGGPVLHLLRRECEVETILDASRLDVPRAVLGSTQMMRLGGNAKSLLVEFTEPQDIHERCGIIICGPRPSGAHAALREVHHGQEVRWMPLPDGDHEGMRVCQKLALAALDATLNTRPLDVPGTALPPANGMAVAVALIPGHRVIWTMRHLERRGVQCTYAGAWVPHEGNGLKTVTVRIPRFGERVRGGDDHNQLGDVSRLQAVLERSGRYQLSSATSWQRRGVETWCALRREFPRNEDACRAVMGCGQPLRSHVGAAAAAMDSSVHLPPIQKMETAPSTCPQRLQFECAAAELIGYHTVDPDEVQRCAHLLFHMATDCGRYTTTVQQALVSGAEKRKCSDGGATLVRRRRVTSARTLNPDYPDAQPRRPEQ